MPTKTSTTASWTNWRATLKGPALSFYVGVPLILGLVFGFSQSGSQPMRGVSGHLAYWLLSSLMSWQLLAVGSKFTSVILRPLGVPLFFVLLGGFAIGITIWGPVSVLRDVVVSGMVEEGQSLGGYSRYSDLTVAISNWTLGACLWISANYLYLNFLRVPRFGYSPPAQRDESQHALEPSADLGATLSQKHEAAAVQPRRDEPVAIEPRLARRLKAPSTSEVLALVAEDHYTRVVMPESDELIYLRFSDAIDEMSGCPGLQVHRSYWVSVTAAKSYVQQGHRAFVELSNGCKFPVSRSYRKIVKRDLASRFENSNRK